ncbi:MAG TPA: HAD-IB family hydrolase [Actinomycetota bacterium]|nr:HAD-IB family hydrolase [Actinomycetota bacterium]
MNDPRVRAAFFDLDKTLVPGSSLFLLARGAYERDLFRVRDLLQFGWGQAMFRLRGEHPAGMEKTRAATLNFAIGRNQQELMGWGKEIAEERIFPRVYADIVRVIEHHQERGDLTFLVTAAPIELAQVIADELGMTRAIGTESEVDDRGCYTGRLAGPVMHGPEKAKAVAEVAESYGLDLTECAAYSDSINDLPLLETVGYAHAVNPERELRRIAMTRGWPVHELRTRRKALLVGIPAGLGGAGLFAGGMALGAALERRRAGRAAGLVERTAHRFHL